MSNRMSFGGGHSNTSIFFAIFIRHKRMSF